MKFRILLLTLIAILSISGVVFADETFVSINDTWIMDDDLVIEVSDVLYGLAAGISDRMGLDYTWHDSANLLVIVVDGNYISYKLDTDLVNTNNKYENMRFNTIAVKNRLYVPLDSLAEKLGFTYTWDEDWLTVNLVSDQLTFTESEVKVFNYTEEDVLWLARIVNVEARSASLTKKIAVANVVLNRVNSDRFPNTIKEVIFQKGQFPPAYYSYFATSEPAESSFIAARRAMMGIIIAENCLFFNNRPFKNKTADFYKIIEGDYFYY